MEKLNNNCIDISFEEGLKQNILSWVKEYIGPDFEFRPYQEDTIYNICYNILTGNNDTTQIIEAPTGSGKSITLIVSAGVLYKYYELKSYILCSDLFLWKQYDDFMFNHQKIWNEFGSIKGQNGNYICSENNEDISHAKCKIARVGWEKLLFDRNVFINYPCIKTCRYIQTRKRALQAGVTLMTYQLYINTVSRINERKNEETEGDVKHASNSNAYFQERPIIFCDECHNIPNIVSGRMSPALKQSALEHFIALYNYNCEFNRGLFADEGKCENLSKKWPHIKLLEHEFNKQFNKLAMRSDIFNKEMAGVEVQSINDFLEHFMKKFSSTVQMLQENMEVRTKSSDMPLSKKEMDTYKHSTWFDNFGHELEEFYKVIKATGSEYLVKYVEDITRTDKAGNTIKDKSIVYKCAKEDYICNKCIVEPSKYRVLVSATIGDVGSYKDNLGIRTAKEDKVDSYFDFSKSPIFISNNVYFTKQNKQRVLPQMVSMITGICKQFINFKGVIQTGSFENTQLLYESLPIDIKSRCLIYKDNAEKANMIEWHKASHNTILIGPTLNEGVDLPGEHCRFIIMMKVPYPNLGDPLVQAKMQLFPKWYDSETSNAVIQGIGRGNRFDKDWCITYILDGCFTKLYNKTKEQYPNFLINRIKFL